MLLGSSSVVILGKMARTQARQGESGKATTACDTVLYLRTSRCTSYFSSTCKSYLQGSSNLQLTPKIMEGRRSTAMLTRDGKTKVIIHTSSMYVSESQKRFPSNIIAHYIGPRKPQKYLFCQRIMYDSQNLKTAPAKTAQNA